MAREDIIAQLMRTLMQKEGPPQESDNTILQKMIVPRDKATLADSVTILSVPSSERIWGSFQWGMSQWGTVSERVFASQDVATVTDNVNMTKLSNGSQPWGGFQWGMNEWE